MAVELFCHVDALWKMEKFERQKLHNDEDDNDLCSDDDDAEDEDNVYDTGPLNRLFDLFIRFKSKLLNCSYHIMKIS